MNSPIETNPSTKSPHLSNHPAEPLEGTVAQSELPDGACVKYSQGAGLPPTNQSARKPPPQVYVEGPPPPQYYYPSQGYAQSGQYYPPTQGYPQGYYAQQPIYYPSPPPPVPPPQNVNSAPSHRPGRVPHEQVEDGDIFENSFNDRVIRKRFVRNVYMILMIQLLITCGITAFFMFHEPTNRMVKRLWWMYILAMFIFLGVYIALVCCGNIRRQVPCNYILLLILTLAESYMTGTLSAYHDTYIVLIAFLATVAVCLLITLFACQTKCDITGWGAYLCIASLVVALFGIIAMFVSLFTSFRLLNLIYSCLITLLFSVYLMYDTQQIMGGHKVEISPDEYIVAVLELYMDVIMIFHGILGILGYSD